MNELEEKFYETGVVPVVVLEDAEDAVPLAQALVEGGLLSAEVTFRTAAAEESIRRMTEAFPQMLVGAGTVLTKEQVDAAAAAGAKFIVSPGFDPEIVDYCLEKKIPVLPGCISPSEVAQAVKRGLTIVKFFPAEQAGGIAMIKAMAAPYVGLKFMPTSGINAGNLTEYLSCDKILCCGGSWMVKGDLVKPEISAISGNCPQRPENLWILSGNSWYLILSDRISTTRQEENKENSDDPWEQCGKNVIQVSQWILAVIPERSGRIMDPVDIYDCPQMGSGTA